MQNVMSISTLRKTNVHSLLNRQLVVMASAGADNFDNVVVFVESVVGKGFISLLDSIMQKVIIDILHRAGDSSEWASGYTLPGPILGRATTALVNLSDIQSKSDAANFLAGKSHWPLFAHFLGGPQCFCGSYQLPFN